MTQRKHIKSNNQTLSASFVVARDRHQKGDLLAAEAIYSQILSIDPADDEVLFLFGALRAARGDLVTGLECLALAQKLSPDNPNIPYTRGVLLHQAGRVEEACHAYEDCLCIAPAHQAALENLAAGYYELNEFDAGLSATRRALAQYPDSRLATRAAANCLTALGRRAESLAVIKNGLRFHPAASELRNHYAWELMANGNFEDGLSAYEWRHQRSFQDGHVARQVPFPRWNGEPLQGKTILVYGDEGVGDELMFSRYVPALVNQGANCILECERRLLPLFSRSFPGINLLPRQEFAGIDWDTRFKNVDFAISSAGLPRLLSWPSSDAPFLKPDASKTEKWHARLQALGTGLKVGVSWRGGGTPTARGLRSIAPGIFGKLMAPTAHFVSLQYGADFEECSQISPDLLCFPEVDALQDLDEFCALIGALDLVISVDNSTVHFAAALGVPTWLLLPLYSEWRWGRDEADALRWYSGLRYFRQAQAGAAGWVQVIAQASGALASFSPPSKNHAPAVLECGRVLPDATKGRHALIIGDTQYWYHWGCSCTSLGLHQGLQKHFDHIATLPLSGVLADVPGPASIQELQSDQFFDSFRQSSAAVCAQLATADVIYVNGEGSIHGSTAAALRLLYLAYVAKTRFGKIVNIVNHSCFPGTGLMPDGRTPVADFYAMVYRAIDCAILREKRSFDNVSAMAAPAVLGFDCLPLFGHTQTIAHVADSSRTVVFGGSVSWNDVMIRQFVALADKLHKVGYKITILSGAKAYLAGDEVDFINRFHHDLNDKGVPYELTFATSERAWLQGIVNASLVVSGRFHYSIAAAFLQVPFIVAQSNTHKIDGLLEALALPIDRVSIRAGDLSGLIRQAQRLLKTPQQGLVAADLLAELRVRAQRNFLPSL